MKKFKTMSLLQILLLALAVAPASSQTTKEILAKMIEAQGGVTILEAIKDTTVNGDISIVRMGIQGGITIYQKEPNKLRMEMEFSGYQITQACDGEKGWMTNPQTGGVEEMPEAQLKEMKRQALGNESLLHPEKLGIKYEFKGNEKIQDQDYLVVEQTFPDGNKNTIFIDPNTYLPHKTKGRSLSMTGVEVDTETIVSDYRKVDGTMVAFSMTVFQDGQESMRLTVSKVAFNSNLDDAFFKLAK